jgi:hypothetical protein
LYNGRMLNAQKSGNVHSAIPSQALIENHNVVRLFRPGLRWSPCASTYPGYRITIHKLNPEGLARALSPSASTSPQNQQPKQSYTKLNKPKQRFGPPGGRGNGGPDAVSFHQPTSGYVRLHQPTSANFDPPLFFGWGGNTAHAEWELLATRQG